uniref:Retrovirus-related Pol polyprotein from transposon TNT 1-94 n=1 Tax=Tanacetum cinerariifolium TaxID=118510 RepID=A0A6L2L899_TANCI|nr:retrovirus-related Pol polyprotein from transposon TNT 1-94 [Tanacetum cinerariifolium]
MAARGQKHRKENNKLAYAPKPKIPLPPKREDLAKHSICHECGKTGHWKRNCPQYLAELLKKKKNAASGAGGSEGRYNNGVSEKRNRTILDMVRSMMSQTTLPKSFWDYALETAARILNMVPTKKVEKTPYEVWHGQAPKLSYLKVCEALVKRDTITKPDKLEPRSIKRIFIGYPKKTMGYSFYYPPENKVLVAQNAKFLKNSLITQKASGSLEDLEVIQEEDTHPCIDTSLNHEEDNLKLMNLKVISFPFVGPQGQDMPQILNAMNVEIQSMKDNEVCVLVELPPNGKIVGSKWLFKKKTDINGVVHTYKTRLVVKGYTQTLGIDYEETFSPVADIRAIRILIAIAAYYDYEIWQMNVKTAFLNGYLNEEVYMEQPKGFVNLKYPNRNVTSQFQQIPGDLQWTTVKNIMKYLRNTKDMFLFYGGDLKRELRVSCYTDARYLTDADDLKSQTGYVFILNGGAVDWKSAKQSIFATSSAKTVVLLLVLPRKPCGLENSFLGLVLFPQLKNP